MTFFVKLMPCFKKVLYLRGELAYFKYYRHKNKLAKDK